MLVQITIARRRRRAKPLGGGQQPAGAAPIAPGALFNLLKIDAVEHDFSSAASPRRAFTRLVDGAVIRHGDSAHTTQQAQHFHHSFLSSDDPLTLPENRRADDALFGAGIDRLARFEPALAQRVVQPVIAMVYGRKNRKKPISSINACAREMLSIRGGDRHADQDKTGFKADGVQRTHFRLRTTRPTGHRRSNTVL